MRRHEMVVAATTFVFLCTLSHFVTNVLEFMRSRALLLFDAMRSRVEMYDGVSVADHVRNPSGLFKDPFREIPHYVHYVCYLCLFKILPLK